jgi:hypothetical protein
MSISMAISTLNIVVMYSDGWQDHPEVSGFEYNRRGLKYDKNMNLENIKQNRSS